MTESDLRKQELITALGIAVKNSDAALISISLHKSNQSTLDSSASQEVLHGDLFSLLSLLKGSTTKLSLALKPSSPTYSAALAPINDISNQVSALSHCVCLFKHNLGVTLVQEVVSVAEDIIRSVKVLCQTFLEIETNNTRISTGQAGDEYMVRTGALHDLINKARAPGGLSTDIITSIRKRLTQNHESLKDGLREIGEMANARQLSPSKCTEEDWEDDGWGELGINSKQMDADEIERAKKVHAILRLSTLLHEHIIKDILAPISPKTLPLSGYNTQSLDALPSLSSALLGASDELVSTMYAPQDTSSIATELSTFLDVIQHLHSKLLGLHCGLSSLVEQMAQMNLQGTGVPQKDPNKWFEICFDQIKKAVTALEHNI